MSEDTKDLFGNVVSEANTLESEAKAEFGKVETFVAEVFVKVEDEVKKVYDEVVEVVEEGVAYVESLFERPAPTPVNMDTTLSAVANVDLSSAANTK